MPLTKFQSEVAKLLAINRSEDSHLAGGAALHFKPDSIRYSLDLDYFHDSEARVASAFEKDRKLLISSGFQCEIEMNQPGYIRCLVRKNKNETKNETKVEWAHDSSWRFMPVQLSKEAGYILHPIDLAINKILALAGRDEPRDYLDVLYTHENILPLGAQCWAACGKDPGFSPLSLLELLKRRGKYRPEDFNYMHLQIKIDVQELKQKWLKALADAEHFVRAAPPAEVGCLYYSKSEKTFVAPSFLKAKVDIIPHYGRPGGVLPAVRD